MCLVFHPNRDRPVRPTAARRRGLTLAELLVAMTIVVLIAGATGALAITIHQASQVGYAQAEAAQHARVVLARIERTIAGAHASRRFPGCAAIARHYQNWSFPDTLVVWRPKGRAAQPDDLPLWNELVIYMPDPDRPNRLLEVTLPDADGSVPPVDDEARWRAELDEFLRSGLARATELTDLLRVESLEEGRPRPALAAVRFSVRRRPSREQWEAYEQGSLAWHELDWPMGLVGPQTALAQTWCAFELQLVPDRSRREPSEAVAIPFFGSAVVHYEIER